MRLTASFVLTALLCAAPAALASALSDDDAVTAVAPQEALAECPQIDAPLPPQPDPLFQRLLRYTQVALEHRVKGLASYYSTFFDGRKTANGEIYRNRKYSAAHLTLPLGTWIEVTSRATGRKLRLRVNDRGPYAKKFCLDLSQAAARYLGVDRTEDRHVDIKIIALPGEEPLPEETESVAAMAAVTPGS